MNMNKKSQKIKTYYILKKLISITISSGSSRSFPVAVDSSKIFFNIERDLDVMIFVSDKIITLIKSLERITLMKPNVENDIIFNSVKIKARIGARDRINNVTLRREFSFKNRDNTSRAKSENIDIRITRQIRTRAIKAKCGAETDKSRNIKKAAYIKKFKQDSIR